MPKRIAVAPTGHRKEKPVSMKQLIAFIVVLIILIIVVKEKFLK